ncbi:erv26 super protein [Xylographa opegraphella]|nr:erv26 super protein [Xylographa opegraphella]
MTSPRPASGLYYLSELVEEHTVAAKKLLTRLIYSVIVLQGLLVAVDRFPVGLSALSIVSHAVYLQNLRFFPTVRLADPVFILSCASTSPYTSSQGSSLPSFTEVASYFFLLIWLVPFALFVSLSASENVLPSMGSEYATDPASPLSPAGVSSSLGAGMSSAGETMASVGAMLSPRSLSRGLARSRSRSQMRGASLGYEDRGRRKRGGGSLVRVAVDGVRGWVGDVGRTLGWGEGRGRF